MEGVSFLALRCFSCQFFQVNQRTKSGKWKCRVCGEGQSIVKVWGRGGHAKDVRGLVMELNAAAGRGEDPTTSVKDLTLRREAQLQRPGAGATATYASSINTQRDRAPFLSENNRSGGPPQPKKGAVGGAPAINRRTGATSYSHEGFVSAGVAPSGSGVGPASKSWDGAHFRTDEDDNFAWRGKGGLAWDEFREGEHYSGSVPRDSAEYDAHDEARSSHRPCFEGLHGQSSSPRTPGETPSRSQGSRWGAFSSDSRQQWQKGRPASEMDKQVQEDPHFVLSLPQQPSASNRRANPASERGKKRGRLATIDTTNSHGSTAAEARTRRTLHNPEESYSTMQGDPSTIIEGSSKKRRCERQSYAGRNTPAADGSLVGTWSDERGGRGGMSSSFGRSHGEDDFRGVAATAAGDSSEFMFSRRVGTGSRPTGRPASPARFGAKVGSSTKGISTNINTSSSSASRWSNFVR